MARILLVEDEPSIAEALSMLLAAEGFEVATASNGEEALRILEQSLPDLVITDYMMPLMNGVEMAGHLRETPRLAGVPILLTSAIDVTLRKIDPSLYDAFVRKPANIDLLLETVRRLLPSPAA
jgi:CheY-like chemotaxis protein